MKRSMKTSMQGMILAFIMMPLIMMSQDRGTRELLPPTNLTGTVSDLNDVHLNWGGPDYGDPFWMHWDSGNNEDSWGFALNAAVYDIAAKWDPSDIDDYDDWKITGIRFFMTHDDANLTIKVWEGPSANEVYSQNVNSYQVNSWTEISFDTPVEIDVSTELWAGVEIDMPYGAYVVGMDDGPAEDEYGNLYRYQGNWYSDFNKNWNLQIEVSPPTSMQSPDGLLGYNIYRDSVKINDEVILD